MRQQFKDTDRTYKTYANAKKIIDSLPDDRFSWLIATTEDGRYFPVIFLSDRICELSYHYLINKGCCVQMV